MSVHGGYVPLRGGTIATAVGIETRGGVLTPLVPAGTAVPAARTEVFTTADDGQPTIKISVFAGSGSRVADATSLGRFELILPGYAQRGIPQIAVTFAVDASGGFQLTAVDGDGRELAIRSF
ncbi:MAG: Hsp70 family protein [Hamadaea sp.]|nr:Hsp70 family protein [Hamadaea sp.]